MTAPRSAGDALRAGADEFPVRYLSAGTRRTIAAVLDAADALRAGPAGDGVTHGVGCACRRCTNNNAYAVAYRDLLRALEGGAATDDANATEHKEGRDA